MVWLVIAPVAVLDCQPAELGAMLRCSRGRLGTEYGGGEIWGLMLILGANVAMLIELAGYRLHCSPLDSGLTSPRLCRGRYLFLAGLLLFPTLWQCLPLHSIKAFLL